MVMPPEDVLRIGSTLPPVLRKGESICVGHLGIEPRDQQKAAVVAAVQTSEASAAYLFQIADKAGSRIAQDPARLNTDIGGTVREPRRELLRHRVQPVLGAQIGF